MIERGATRLDQSVKIAASLGIDPPSSGLWSENQIRNAIWCCIVCRHGSECAGWINAGTPGVPGFRRNREFDLERARDAA